MMNNMIYTNSTEDFVKTICDVIKIQANKRIKEKESFTFVLSGGRTPKSIFQELVLNYKNSIDWRKIHLFWLDERSVEHNHEDSNYKLAYDNLISNIDNIGSIHSMQYNIDPKLTAKEYKQDIQKFFNNSEIKFDFILLGMGEDGHVASLFPNSTEITLKDEVVLATEKKHNGYYRISLGLNLINKSSFKLLMVNSNDKLNILKSKNLNYPVNLVDDKTIVVLGDLLVI